MSRPQTPASSMPSRLPAPAAVLDTTTVSAGVMRNRSASSASRDGKARELLDSSMGEKELASNPKTRKDWAKFTQLVDRTLQSFENVSEWADFITFLSKLLKCLQAYPNFAYIPHRLVVAKRLAQCLNPALPTGVHQRALDVYVHILNAIGPENLRKDLQLWSSGLFPFFQYSATSVRPIVLGIYSKFYIPLQDALRPATKAMILALLPGLEEETGEYFDKVAGLLDQLSGTVSPAFFLQNIWLVLITSPSLRIAALNYLGRRMPKIRPEDSIAPIVGDDVGLMVRAFTSALEDSQVLVQRATLDLVLTTLQTDGSGFQNDTRHEEQLLLVKAMAGVVLRRDLSLSRRLYTWLLGSSEESEAQVEHLRRNALPLLRECLVKDIEASEAETSDLALRQRPLKIIISLLDKWEIAYPLTEVIVLDLLQSLIRVLNQESLHDELMVTANNLFDGLDPFLTWRQLFWAVHDQLRGEVTEVKDALQLVEFVVDTFRLDDDEVTRLHAPLTAFALLDMASTQGEIQQRWMAVSVSHALLKETSRAFFTQPTKLAEPSATDKDVGFSTAKRFYEAKDNKSAKVPPEGFAGDLLSNGLAVTMAMICRSIGADELHVESLASQFAVLAHLAEHLPRDVRVPVIWQPEQWLSDVLTCLDLAEQSYTGFSLVETAVDCLLAVRNAPISPPLDLDTRKCISSIVNKLLSFLQPSAAPFHIQAVNLLWSVQEVSRHRHVESSIAECLTSPDRGTRQAAYDAFGVLWRYTDDSQVPGIRLSIPMHIMLDALRSDDLEVRRSGEAWMRCSVKSYLRILDPLLFTLMGPSALAESVSKSIGGVEIRVDEYYHVFECARVHHALDNLLSLVSFGGQGFTRLSKATSISQSPYKALTGLAGRLSLANDSYLDAVCHTLVRLLRSEASDKLGPAINPANKRIHAMAADLLQLIISRGDIDLSVLQSIESVLTVRLYLCIHRHELDLQNKLLHVLHSAVSAISNLKKKADRRSTSSRQSIDYSIDSLGGHEPLLVKVLSDAITKQRSSAVIHHWVDFLLITIQQLRGVTTSLIFPLIDAISARLAEFVDELGATYNTENKGKKVASDLSDADYTILLNALERLFSFALEDAKAVTSETEVASSTEKGQASNEGASAGFLGYITTALGGTDGAVAAGSSAKPKSPVGARVEHFIKLLMSAWDTSAHLEELWGGDQHSTEGYIAVHVKARTRKALERLYKSNAKDVTEGIIDVWHSNSINAGDNLTYQQERLFDILDHLSGNPQVVVTMITDGLIQNLPADKSKVALPSDMEIEHFEFLEAFIGRLDGPLAVQIWTPFGNFVKDFASNPTIHKYRLRPSLRCVTALAERIASTSALEDKRLRRDLHETFMKLTDATIQMSGRTGDGLRRPVMVKDASVESTPMETNGPEKLDASMMSEKSAANKRSEDTGKELTLYLARRVVPNFRKFSIDNEKLAATCANMMYYIVAPSFKTRAKSFEVDDSVLELLSELTRVPAGLKSWRAQVLEIFSDIRFFYGPPDASRKWKTIIQALVASDKERFPELISKISAASSANIFVNRELESLSKAMSIRRLSYVIFCGEKNRYLVQLPTIQEKIVELLRAQVSDLVHSEVYLCLRVLLCRIGNQHLSGFWPIILTELLRLFESLMSEPAAPTGEYLQLILSACKFLDLLLVLQTEEFQIHQWMFITDTVDAVYPPDNWTPQAIMDRLGEIIGSRQDLLTNTTASYTNATPRLSIAGGGGAGTNRDARSRPLLSTQRLSKIASVGALEPFFSRASLATYEAVYRLGGVDWPAVEQSVELDLFEGEE